jgi:endonuclease/exonuclease/phosphatase family metal-dependent hydrolase
MVLIAYFHFGSFIKLSTKKPSITSQNQLKILSFNVRLFNFYETKESQKNIPKMMASYFKKEQPDILCLQEFNKNIKINFSEYPHHYIHFKNKNILGHAIYSKHPLINTHTFNFKDSFNNTIVADVIKGKDTIRVYNIHLQSFSIPPSMKYLQEVDNEVLRKRVSTRFVKQQNQVEKILQHKNKSNSPVIITGDFNNTAFSYVYHQLSKDMNDAFLLAGSDIGTTFIFENYPMRIDFLLATKDLKVLDFNTINKTFSDHYPISAIFGWN